MGEATISSKSIVEHPVEGRGEVVKLLPNDTASVRWDAGGSARVPLSELKLCDDPDEAPELGKEFFENAVLTRPGENIVHKVDELLQLECPSCGGDPDVDCICKRQNG